MEHFEAPTDLTYRSRVKKRKGRWVPPREVVRQWMKDSSEGGRGRCLKCKTSFAMVYLRHCHIDWITEGLVCVDCKKAHNLMKV